MKIKTQSIQNLVGEVEICRVFERIKKVYPNTKYFNPFDPNYNGVALNADNKPLDGFKIENTLRRVAVEKQEEANNNK